MKKITHLVLLFSLTFSISYSQKNDTLQANMNTAKMNNEKLITPEVTKAMAWTIKEMAIEKSQALRIELSLSENQQEELAKRIYKYSIKATSLLQSEKDDIEKTIELHALATSQKQEFRNILSEKQYQYYARKDYRYESRLH